MVGLYYYILLLFFFKIWLCLRSKALKIYKNKLIFIFHHWYLTYILLILILGWLPLFYILCINYFEKTLFTIFLFVSLLFFKRFVFWKVKVAERMGGDKEKDWSLILRFPPGHSGWGVGGRGQSQESEFLTGLSHA